MLIIIAQLEVNSRGQNRLIAASLIKISFWVVFLLKWG